MGLDQVANMLHSGLFGQDDGKSDNKENYLATSTL
eukprot:COSAG01_NODE_12_length_41732_cov_160.472964_20_plen_35_part_00